MSSQLRETAEDDTFPVSGISLRFSEDASKLAFLFKDSADFMDEKISDSSSQNEEKPYKKILQRLQNWATNQPTPQVIPGDFENYELSEILCGTIALLHLQGIENKSKTNTACGLHKMICDESKKWEFRYGSLPFRQLFLTLVWLTGYYKFKESKDKSHADFKKLGDEASSAAKSLAQKLLNIEPDFFHNPSINHYTHCWNNITAMMASHPIYEFTNIDDCANRARELLENFRDKLIKSLSSESASKKLNIKTETIIYFYISLYPLNRKIMTTNFCLSEKDTIKRDIVNYLKSVGHDFQTAQELTSFSAQIALDKIKEFCTIPEDIIRQFFPAPCKESSSVSGDVGSEQPVNTWVYSIMGEITKKDPPLAQQGQASP